ncbi:MAG: large subunit ribosomal protein L10 [Planctomycetota bacterium]|jgi:large subunit ribosomal protein L10
MPSFVNKMVLRELTTSIKGADSMVIVSMHGLTVQETDGFRNSLAEGGVRLHMVRNSLAKMALKDCGVELAEDVFKGNVAIAVGHAEEAIHAAKVVKESKIRKEGKIDFRGGLLEGEVLDASSAQALAAIPNKDTLRAMILGVLSAPARSLVGVINAPTGALVRVIQAHVDAEGGDGGGE